MQQETNEQMQKMSNNMMQACSDMNNIMRDTVNATLESITIMTKGCNELCNQVSSLMQKNLEQTAKMSQTMMSASSRAVVNASAVSPLQRRTRRRG